MWIKMIQTPKNESQLVYTVFGNETSMKKWMDFSSLNSSGNSSDKKKTFERIYLSEGSTTKKGSENQSARSMY